jgi:hypothetical protein
MLQQDVAPDSETAYAVLSLLIQCEGVVVAQKWLMRMVQVGMSPSPETFAMCTPRNLCDVSSGARGAAELHVSQMLRSSSIMSAELPRLTLAAARADMKRKDETAETAVSSATIAVLETERWVQVMQSEGIAPSLDVLLELVLVCIRSVSLSKSSCWLSAFLETSPGPDQFAHDAIVKGISSLLTATCEEVDVQIRCDLAMQVLSMLLRSGRKPSEQASLALLTAALRVGASEIARLVLETITPCGADKVTTASCELILAALSEERAAKIAEQFLNDMIDHGPAPNAACYGLVVSAYVNDSNTQRAEHWLTTLVGKGLHPPRSALQGLTKIWWK